MKTPYKPANTKAAAARRQVCPSVVFFIDPHLAAVEASAPPADDGGVGRAVGAEAGALLDQAAPVLAAAGTPALGALCGVMLCVCTWPTSRRRPTLDAAVSNEEEPQVVSQSHLERPRPSTFWKNSLRASSGQMFR